MYGAIEAGGTKFVCSIGDADLNIVDQVTFPTDSPEITMPKVIAFFDSYRDSLESIGIGSFGPIDIDEESPTYGYITMTPKYLWRNVNFLGIIKQAFPELALAWTTDVNAAAYGEYRQRANVNSLVYYTVGTGFGGGVVQNGQFIQSKSHPEMGHILVRKHADDSFKGHCPNHGDCLEGLVCGPAIEARMGRTSKEIDPQDSFWDIQAYYLAQSAYNATLYIAPEMIVYGGGVMKVEGLMEKVRKEFHKINQGYLPIEDLETYISTPSLEDNSATLGCFHLAKEKVKTQKAL